MNELILSIERKESTAKKVDDVILEECTSFLTSIVKTYLKGKANKMKYEYNRTYQQYYSSIRFYSFRKFNRLLDNEVIRIFFTDYLGDEFSKFSKTDETISKNYPEYSSLADQIILKFSGNEDNPSEEMLD